MNYANIALNSNLNFYYQQGITFEELIQIKD